MAASRVAVIPELLDLLGKQVSTENFMGDLPPRTTFSNTEQINARRLLHKLCLVNRMFNTAFIPHLYKCLRWDDRNITFLSDNDKQQLLLDSGNLVHTRIFAILETAISCCMKTWETGNPQHQRDWNEWHYSGQEMVYTEICDAVIKLLPKLKTIHSFV